MSLGTAFKAAFKATGAAGKKAGKVAGSGFKQSDDIVRSSHYAIDAIHEIINPVSHIDPVKNRVLPDSMKALEEASSNTYELISEFDISAADDAVKSELIDLANRAKKFDKKIDVTYDDGLKGNALRQFEEDISTATPTGGKAIGLAGDSPEGVFLNNISALAESAPNLETFYKGIESPMTRDFFGGADDIIDKESSLERLDSYINNNDKEKISGFVEREAEFFDIQAKPSQQASQISNIFGETIRRSFRKAEDGLPVVLTHDETSILGSAMAYKKVKTVQESLKRLSKKGGFEDVVFRKEGTVKTVSDFEKVIDDLASAMEDDLLRKTRNMNLKNKLVVHNGKSFHKLVDEGQFSIRKVDGKLEMNDASRYILSQDEPIFNDMFKHITAGALKKLPDGLSRTDIESSLSLLAKAAFLNKASGRPITSARQLAYYYADLDPVRFGVLEDAKNIEFLERVLDPVLSNKKYMDDAMDIVYNEQFIVNSNSQLKKLLKNDHSLPSKVRGKINESTKSKIKGFTFSERGYTGRKTKPMNVDDGFSGAEGILDDFDTPKAAGKATKESKRLTNLLNDDNWWTNFVNKASDIVPAMRHFMKNYGLKGATTELPNRVRRYLNGTNAFISDFTVHANKVWLKSSDAEKTLFMGLLQTGSEMSDKFGQFSVRYNKMLAMSKKMDDELEAANFYVDKNSKVMGSQITRKQPGRISDNFYEEVHDALRAKINAQSKVNLNKAVNDVLNDYGRTGKEFEELMLAINDIVNPFDALQRRISNQLKTLIQVGIVKEVKKADVFRTRATTGFAKLPDDIINPFFLEEVFGTKNIYLPRSDIEQISRVAREYSRLSKTTTLEMAKELNIQGNRFVRHNLISNSPATWFMAHTSNMMILSGNAGISPMQYFKRFKEFDLHLKNYTDRYQEFLASGVATDSVLMGEMGKRIDHRSARTGVRGLSANQKYNIFSPNSQASNVAMYHLLEKPDKAARFMIWDELTKAGKSNSEIRQIIATTMGFSEDVPKLVNLFAEIPGGDIFARYAYTFTNNFMKTISRNPKQMAKTLGTLAAVQTATLHLFLNEEERGALKAQNATWIKPGIFNAIRGDPSFATPTGQYYAFSYASPWATSFGSPGESMNPFAQLIRASMTGMTPEQALRENSKLWRKSSQGAQHIMEGEIGKAITGTAGVVDVDLRGKEESTPSGFRRFQ